MPVLNDKLIQALVLGTERSPLDAASVALLSEVTPLSAADPARSLLDALAVERVARRAGFVLAAPDMEAVAACPPESLKVCSSASAQDLHDILYGKHGAALPEYLRLLALARKILPPRHLPALLERSLTDAALRRALWPVWGERGRRLAAQNPAWQSLVPEERRPAKPAKTDKKAAERQAHLLTLVGLQWKNDVEQTEQGWSSALLTAFFQQLDTLAPNRWSMQHEYLKPLLLHAAYYCDTRDGEAVRAAYKPPSDVALYFWRREMERFFRIIAFRRHMRLHIEATP